MVNSWTTVNTSTFTDRPRQQTVHIDGRAVGRSQILRDEIYEYIRNNMHRFETIQQVHDEIQITPRSDVDARDIFSELDSLRYVGRELRSVDSNARIREVNIEDYYRADSAIAREIDNDETQW